jgi:EAL domain-containing protein (putative c-di-GMP-specific phosphodiesterase class I)
LDVISYIAELLFDLTHRLEVSSTVEGVSTEQQELMIMMMMMMMK